MGKRPLTEEEKKKRRRDSRVVTAGVPRFEGRDLRAKSATDDELVAASRRLGHSDLRVTQAHYRRRPEKVKPLR